jgi:hypothetical protein
LIGGTSQTFAWEMESIIPWIPFFLIIAGLWFPIAILAGILLLLLRQIRYGSELVRNRYPFPLIIYYVPAVVLYAGVLLASYFSFSRGKVEWKGREVATSPAGKAASL